MNERKGAIRLPSLRESYCLRHRRYLATNEFYKSINPKHDSGYLPYCKTCIDKMVTDFLKKYGSLEAAIYYTCAEMGVPFIQKAFEACKMATQSMKSPRFFGFYIEEISKKPTEAQKEKWVDFGASDIALEAIRNSEPSTKSVELQEAELQLAWGKEYNSEQLAYLEYRYTSYTQDKVLSEYEESVYRNLCRAELDIYERNDLDNATKRQSQCAKLLKLDQFMNSENKSVIERMLENDIVIMEQYEPAEYYKNKKLYKDFRGIHSSWVLEILRPIKNLVTGSKEYPIEEEDMDVFEDTMEEMEDDETVDISIAFPEGDRTQVPKREESSESPQ